MQFEPQLWIQFGPLVLAFGYLLWFVLGRLKESLDANTQAIRSLERQVELNTMVLTRLTGQNLDDVRRLQAVDHEMSA